MCGICGIVPNDPAGLVGRENLLAMRDALVHRGPDDAGSYLAPGVALGCRRLAILDLSERGHMPMTTADGRYWITYNGEIYNYRELRRDLEARGCRFRSGNDTEVVLHLYAAEGPAMLDRLNGMFAFAIWDTRERKLILARDRLGIKPLYYSCKRSALYFASEEKALFAAGIPAEFNPDTWEELLCFRYVAGEDTPFAGVRRLLPGHYLTWKEGDLRIRRWWSLAERVRAGREKLPPDPVEWFRATFDDAVRLRRISDVPVGVLLSGGLDSSSVAASLASAGGSEVLNDSGEGPDLVTAGRGSVTAHQCAAFVSEPRPQGADLAAEQAISPKRSSTRGSGTAAFTVRFQEPEYDEGPLALEVARRWHLDFHELRVAAAELMPLLQTASWLNDEPLAHGNDPHLWALSRYAKSRVTVLLSGEGADETLGGYVRYRPLRYPLLMKAARPFLPRLASTLKLNGRLDKLARFLATGPMDRLVLFNACDTLPAELACLGMKPKQDFAFREQVLADAIALYPSDPARQAMFSDQQTFLCSILDRNDRMTMGASIECRVPFLDYRLVEGLGALPSSVLFSGRRNKSLLRDSLGIRLPQSVQRSQKWGFRVPWRLYLRRDPEWRRLVKALPDLDPIRDGPFERTRLKSIVDDFLRGDASFEILLRQFVMTAVWYEACLGRVHLGAASSYA